MKFSLFTNVKLIIMSERSQEEYNIRQSHILKLPVENVCLQEHDYGTIISFINFTH